MLQNPSILNKIINHYSYEANHLEDERWDDLSYEKEDVQNIFINKYIIPLVKTFDFETLISCCFIYPRNLQVPDNFYKKHPELYEYNLAYVVYSEHLKQWFIIFKDDGQNEIYPLKDFGFKYILYGDFNVDYENIDFYSDSKNVVCISSNYGGVLISNSKTKLEKIKQELFDNYYINSYAKVDELL